MLHCFAKSNVLNVIRTWFKFCLVFLVDAAAGIKNTRQVNRTH